MYSPRNHIKHLFHEDLLMLSLRRMKEEEKRKKEQGKQARNGIGKLVCMYSSMIGIVSC